jgi:hypothetical protein
MQGHETFLFEVTAQGEETIAVFVREGTHAVDAARAAVALNEVFGLKEWNAIQVINSPAPSPQDANGG